MLGLKLGYSCRQVIGSGLRLTPVSLARLHFLLALLNHLFSVLDHLHQVFALFLPGAFKHIDYRQSMLIHESRCLIGKLSIDGIFLTLIHLDLHLILDVLTIGYILVLAEGVHEGCRLSENVIIITIGRTKSILD